MEARYRNSHIRRLILSILHSARRAGQTMTEGYLNHLMLRTILSDHGHDLTDNELKDFVLYLEDAQIGCAEMKRVGLKPPYLYKSRITAKGVQVLEGTIKIRGIDGPDGE